MIQRIREYTKRNPSRDARKIYLVCEDSGRGPEYFRYFVGLSSNLDLIPIPSEDGRTDPVKLQQWVETNMLNQVSSYTLDYEEQDQVWFIIDTDTWQEEGKIEKLRDFCRDQNEQNVSQYPNQDSYDMWNIAQSNPMMEIWYYYHVYEQHPEKKEVSQFTSFKEFLSAKINGGFQMQIHPAYLQEAINNAKANFYRDEDGYPQLYSTELYILGEKM